MSGVDVEALQGGMETVNYTAVLSVASTVCMTAVTHFSQVVLQEWYKKGTNYAERDFLDHF